MRISWQHVAVVGLILAAVVTLAALGQDTTALLGLGTLILAGVGLLAGQQQSIRDQTNGNTTRLLAMVERMSSLLATMQPAAIDTTRVIDGDSTITNDLGRSAEEEHDPVTRRETT